VAIAADQNNAYFNDNGTIKQAPLAGGGSVLTLGGGLSSSAVAVDATRVYFVGPDGGVGAVPIGGNQVTVLAPSPSLNGPMAINATNVFWSTWFATADAGTIETVAK
jgi:hypothetical protein